jgi:hypothetical protein
MLMHRAILFAKRNRFLVAATALLMVGAGCVSAVHETTKELQQEALSPITAPVQVYKLGVDAASGTEALRRNQLEQGGESE